MNEDIQDLVRAINNLARVHADQTVLLREQMKIQREMIDMQKEIHEEAKRDTEKRMNMLEAAKDISGQFGKLKDLDPEVFKNVAEAAKYQMDKQREEDEEFKRRIHPKER